MLSLIEAGPSKGGGVKGEANFRKKFLNYRFKFKTDLFTEIFLTIK